ncbi:HAMP domain-containing sensor histidine kinase [Hydrogenophaga sp.]|jgi:signal transduction histidine kinase|uniref:sensor histidine kinase n=1 Tax=Hydrogenophaga sp. TaxID=1904254 RepID=UPI00271CEF17|nr:ATP-binding protein [Hydrogenophaga sp.]MDO9603197.1 ATP-binding protein [Hydrogenophaga sp.]
MNWPRTLFGRLMLILLAGLLLAQALTFVLVFAERGQAMRRMMVSYLAADVASSVAMLDRLPASERADWLPRLQRANYQLSLHVGPPGGRANPSPLAAQITHVLSQALAQPVQAFDAPVAGVAMRLHLQLRDGTPMVVDLAEPRLLISPWVIGVLTAQLVLLAGVCAVAVRQATRPLSKLAEAAAALAPGQPTTLLPETGPIEVVQATCAFNRMRERIEETLLERTQMLAAISHDLQTPLTRMRLRADLLADEVLRDKLQADLTQMQHLVEQGLTYARSAHPAGEAAVPTDIVALLESLVADYQDASQPVRWIGGPPCKVTTQPAALRRAVANLIDNAIKYGEEAEVVLIHTEHRTIVRVMDRGPGIPAEEREKVLEPFYRIEGSRNAATGGSGLGLAIVQRLLVHCRAELALSARDGGGLVADIRIKHEA